MVACLVLGGGGFIGSNLVLRLCSLGHDVRWIDNGNVPQWRLNHVMAECNRNDWHTTGVGFDLADWDDYSHGAKLFQQAEWIFHLAADMGGVGYFHSDADLGAALRNGRITNNVLRHLQPHQRLFYASSACAYPVELMSPGAGPLREKHLGFGTPDALYGADKLHGLRLCSKLPNARVGIFDTIYGPLQDHEGRRTKFPAAVARKALEARQTGTLELWGDGKQTRCYLYIEDALDRILTVMADDDYEGPVNIGHPQPVDCEAVARMCLDIAGVRPVKITYNAAEPSGAQWRALDQSEYVRRYGETLAVSPRFGFIRFMQWLEGVMR